jgi:hypothetical protein
MAGLTSHVKYRPTIIYLAGYMPVEVTFQQHQDSPTRSVRFPLIFCPSISSCNGQRQKQPQVLRLHLAQRTRQTPLRMTDLWWSVHLRWGQRGEPALCSLVAIVNELR